jgi:hypothetical protein
LIFLTADGLKKMLLGEKMEQTNLFMICLSAFMAVFVLLALLSALMRMIITIFPQKISDTDSAVLAAVVTTVSSIYPGTKVTKIGEIK